MTILVIFLVGVNVGLWLGQFAVWAGKRTANREDD
jgi:hypothetical protein